MRLSRCYYFVFVFLFFFIFNFLRKQFEIYDGSDKRRTVADRRGYLYMRMMGMLYHGRGIIRKIPSAAARPKVSVKIRLIAG